MDKLLRNNAFTLVEMLLVLLIISVFSMGFRVPESNLTIFMEQIMNESILCQEMAFLKKKEVDVSFYSSYAKFNDSSYIYPSKITCSTNSFHYNENGNISKACTIACSNGIHTKKLIFQLGSGRVRIDEQ